MTSGSGPKLTINKIYIIKKFLAFSAFLLAFSFQANAMDSATDNLLPEAEALKNLPITVVLSCCTDTFEYGGAWNAADIMAWHDFLEIEHCS